MVRRVSLSVLLAVALTLALVWSVGAGGWAVVTLDSLPRDVRAGQTTLTLGFMVRQHGITPNSQVEPVLTARNRAGGETVRAEARQVGETGHFVVNVTFPSAGVWEWEIEPYPFAATKFEPLTVLAPAASAPSPLTTVGLGSAAPLALRVAGLLALGAGALLLVARRPTRRLAVE